MPGIVLVLGPVAFQDFEIPKGINFGGSQLLAVHQLTDGRRILDNIGPDESKISFSGAFSGPDATLRARILNSLRVTGSELDLTWDVFYYTVILSRFSASYENPMWIPYRISCTVVRDEATSAIPSSISLDGSVLADLNVAANTCVGLNVDFINLQNIAATSNATTLGTTAYVAVQVNIQTIQSTINSLMISAENILQTAISSDLASPGLLMESLIISTVASQQMAGLTSANAYVGRAARNLLNAST
jgi:hypothetical protein